MDRRQFVTGAAALVCACLGLRLAGVAGGSDRGVRLREAFAVLSEREQEFVLVQVEGLADHVRAQGESGQAEA